jgi:bacteriocin-like protein
MKTLNIKELSLVNGGCLECSTFIPLFSNVTPIIDNKLPSSKESYQASSIGTYQEGETFIPLFSNVTPTTNTTSVPTINKSPREGLATISKPRSLLNPYSTITSVYA